MGDMAAFGWPGSAGDVREGSLFQENVCALFWKALPGTGSGFAARIPVRSFEAADSKGPLLRTAWRSAKADRFLYIFFSP